MPKKPMTAKRVLADKKRINKLAMKMVKNGAAIPMGLDLNKLVKQVDSGIKKGISQAKKIKGSDIIRTAGKGIQAGVGAYNAVKRQDIKKIADNMVKTGKVVPMGYRRHKPSRY